MRYQWGITWSGRWHALTPADTRDKDEAAAVCSSAIYVYVLDGHRRIPTRVRAAANNPATPLCTRCIAKAGPRPTE